MRNKFEAIIITFIFICICISGISFIYKKSEVFKRNNVILRNYIEKVPYGLKIVNLGSTYAKFAFKSYSCLGINGFNFALDHQTLEYDYEILKHYRKHLDNNCIVIIPIAACLLLFSNEEKSDLQYYYAFGRRNVPKHSIKNEILYSFPFLKDMKSIIFNEGKKAETIYDIWKKPTCDEDINKNMAHLVDIWKDKFGLSDLRKNDFSEKNIITIEDNYSCLNRIITYCKDEGLQYVIVVPPFSKYLNEYFSNEFLERVLPKNDSNMRIYDFQKDSYFQDRPDLFSDGGFRLNQRGSIIFMKRLFEKISENGITINNESVGKC